MFLSERRVSNPQPPAWKAGALPIELLSLNLTLTMRQPSFCVGTGGFEPPKLAQQIYSLSHLATLVYPLKKSRRRDSNPRPTDYKSVALPAELLRLNFLLLKNVRFNSGCKFSNIFCCCKKKYNFFCIFSKKVFYGLFLLF